MMKELAYYDGRVGAPEEVMIPFNDRVHFLETASTRRPWEGITGYFCFRTIWTGFTAARRRWRSGSPWRKRNWEDF